MKNSILYMLLFTVTVSFFSLSADSCDSNSCKPKRYQRKLSHKKSNSSCNEQKVNHNNRTVKSCGKNGGKKSCSQKNVRMNKYARRDKCA